MQRLDFRLPDFVRIAWVSAAARDLWLPRIERIQAAWRVIERASVVEGIRDCGIVFFDGTELVDVSQQLLREGVYVLPLERTTLTPDVYQSVIHRAEAHAPYCVRVAIGSPDGVRRFQVAWDDDDDEVIGDLLGYPPCCRASFRLTWCQLGLRDPTWPMAGGGFGECDTRTTIELVGRFETNVLARFVGVRAVPHLPCRFDCAASAGLAQQLLAVGAALGYDLEMSWLREMLAWPYEWSALHGIAEIRTPVMKVAASTDSTAIEYRVRLTGTAYPPRAAVGNRFPCRTEDVRTQIP